MNMENEKKNKRKALILTIIAVLTLLALVGGATYAYFQAQAGEGGQANVNVTTGTTDSLTFSVLDKDVTREGNDDSKENIIDDNNANEIVISAKESNFGKTGTSLGDGVTGSAILIAGSDDYKAEDKYNVYLNITKNELQYSSYKKDTPDEPDTGKNVLTYTTTEAKSKATEEALTGYSPIPELYLTIKKGETEIKEGVTINGVALNYTPGLFGDPDVEDKTDKTLGGFDITEAKGLIKIRTNEPITVNGNADNHTTTDEWEIMITFKNLEYDQNINTGKSLTGEVLIQKEEYVSQDIKTLNKLLADSNKEETTLYYHDNNLTGGAQDGSYRYAGSFEKVKNFVCLDGGETSEGTCANNDSDLYRIIGLFKNNNGQYEMKLIKYDYATSEQLGDKGAYKSLYNVTYPYSSDDSNYKGPEEIYNTIGGYYWTSDSNEVNEWAGSELSKINLNEYYLNTYLKGEKHIDIDNLIETHTWSLNGHDSYEVTPKVMYDNEMDRAVASSPSVPTLTKEKENKIGLIYISDYGYATSPSSTSDYTTIVHEYDKNNIPDNNWMYMGLFEWTFSRNSATNNHAFYVYNTGLVDGGRVYYNAFGVRPSFYITSSVKIKSGDGSKGSPYRLQLN